MSVIFASKYRWLVSVSVGLLIVVAVGLWLTHGAPVYGQAAPDPRIPDLHGQWQGELVGYVFENSLTPTTKDPQYIQVSSPDEIINITDQTGRAFAGSMKDATLTGVILPDGTVRIQGLGEGELRSFATLKLGIERGKYVMSGTIDAFDDLHDGVDEPLMGTVLVRYVKLD